MNILLQNDKRQLVEEYGPYMNKRWAVYDNLNILEVWFSDKVKALEWWTNNCDRETWAEKREKQRKELQKVLEVMQELPYEELPFM